MGGHAENKQITELLPGILNQLGAESLTHLKKLASNVTGGGAGSGLDGTGVGADDDDDEKSSPSALPAGPTEEKKEEPEPVLVQEEPKTDSKPAKKEGFYLPMPEEDELGFDSVEGLGDLDSSDDDEKSTGKEE